MKLKHLILLSIICCSQSVFGQKANQQPKTSGNPVFPGWYADPEGVVFGDEYWIYPTYSAPYDEQTFMDAFSSKDLVNWTKHPKVLSKENISWFKRALWAPAVIHANDKYYILDTKGNYILTNYNDIFPYIEYRYLDINNIKEYIKLATYNDNIYSIKVSDIVLNSNSSDVITIKVDEDNKNIIIDYTNLFKIDNNNLTKEVVSIKYSNINKINSLEK